MMRYGKISHALAVMAALFLMVGLNLPGSVCHAKNAAKGEWAFPDHYPNKFDGQGYINRIGREGIVIDDCSFSFSAYRILSTPTRKHASQAHFRPGDPVGYLVNERKQIEGLYLLKQ
jgi:hypothetical protein